MELPSACVREGNACISECLYLQEGVCLYLQGGARICKRGPLYLRGEVLVFARGVLWDACICQNSVVLVFARVVLVCERAAFVFARVGCLYLREGGVCICERGAFVFASGWCSYLRESGVCICERRVLVFAKGCACICERGRCLYLREGALEVP